MPEILDGEVLSEQKINDYLNHTLLEPEEYTPAVGNATATATGTFLRIGKRVEVEFLITFGGGGNANGITLGLPSTIRDFSSLGFSMHALGEAMAFDTSGSVRRSITVLAGGSASASFLNDASGALVTGTVPFTWAAGDTLRGRLSYWEA